MVLESTTVQHVSDLPGSLLRTICNFLSPTSHLVFAVALSDGGLTSKPSPSSKAIISTKSRATIDFGDNNDVALVEKLTDDDLVAILQCIDAPRHVKQLRLTSCKSIVGHGLSPLRHSTVLEQVDFSIVEANSEEADTVGKLSLDAVLPILRDIINQEGSSFKQLQLPKLWRQEQDGRLTAFLVGYNEFLNARNSRSSHPDTCKSASNHAFVWVPTRESKYGLQSLTCYECNEHLCAKPQENDYKNLCAKCEKTFCRECVPSEACEECKETTCHSCTHIGTCQDCKRVTCIHCLPVLECPCCHGIRCDDCGPMMFCSLCNSSNTNCEGCPAEKLYVESCDFCEENFCSECRVCTFCDDCGEMYCEKCKYGIHHLECSSKRARVA
jgi:hypothetical protein